MYVQFGEYVHASGEVAVSVSITNTYSQHLFAYMRTHKWKLRGKILSDNVTDLVTAINLLRAGYSTNGFGIGLFQDNNDPTDLIVNAGDTLGGVRIGELSFPEDGEKTAEYTTFRTYEITLEADYLVTDHQILAYHETLNFEGGGPRYVWIETRTGDPQQQMVSQATTYRCTQTGAALGLQGYVPFPQPLFPQFELPTERKTTLDGPKVHAGNLIEFPCSWSYTFESAQAFAGTPTIAF